MAEVRIAIGEKYLLTVIEAAAYFNIGIKKMRRMAENNDGGFALYYGNRYLIVRTKLEEYMLNLAERKADKDEESSIGE
ncbi:MAG: excisionase family DNA-binding protein [Bacteroides sp.]|nr:excisionase family DNA-binding protein [Eubacterium sp.]MCM1463358.1 excisionase family DNA-binding protein [Bacteroides sp.]